MDPNLTIIFKRMAWQRAKGELNSILECYFNDSEAYDEMRIGISNFIEWVEKESPIA